MLLQRLAGNRSVARLLTEDQHSHGPGCGHDKPGGRHDVGGLETAGGGGPARQRTLMDEAMASPSRPLPDTVRTRAESFYNNDFSAAVLHDGPVAQRATEAMGAQAMTVGTHVFLPPGRLGDSELIGHELSHVDKNLRGERETGTSNGAGVTVTDPGQPSERAAGQDGAAFAAGAPTAPSVTAQRMHHEAPHPDTATVGITAAQRSAGSAATGPIQRATQGDAMELDSSEDLLSSDEEMAQHWDRLQDPGRQSELERIRGLHPVDRKNEFRRELRRLFSEAPGWAVEPKGQDFEAFTPHAEKSKPRDFKDQPEVQRLRWISTVTKHYLLATGRKPIEVQAAIGANDEIIVAANDRDSNHHLSYLMTDEGVTDLLGYMLENSKPATGQKSQEDRDEASRINRHREKASGIQHDETRENAKTRTALASGIIIAKDGGDGTHAEMRIKKKNNGRTPEHLAGTKRPCASCFAELYPTGSPKDAEGKDLVRPGRFYSSRESNLHFPEFNDSKEETPRERAQKVFNRVTKSVPRTYESSSKTGGPLRGYGSESE
ncbi:eCIS core domain-containing protein [Streptomyces sp. NPDC004561]